MWFTAHAIMWLRFKEGPQDYFPAEEALLLVCAPTPEIACREAESLARQHYAGDDGGSVRCDGRPAERVFGSIRRLIACPGREDGPGHGPDHGSELSRQYLRAESRGALDALIAGHDSLVLLKENRAGSEQPLCDRAPSAPARPSAPAPLPRGSRQRPFVTDEYKRVVVGGVRHYGKHLVLSAAGCCDALLCKDSIRQFLRTMVARIDMTAYGDPIVERFGSGIEIGISAVQLIETSAIVMHTNDGARDLYLDVFSCKDFDEQQAIAVVREAFAPLSLDAQTLLRR